MKEILKVSNLVKKYGKKTILYDVSFGICEGEICGFLGPNGAGKSTVIKCIMGLVKKNSGEISVCGYDINKQFEKAAENFGGIIETPEMYGNLSAEKNLKVLSMLYKGVDKKRIYEILEKVGLKGHEKEKVKTFSLGMKQRLGLAQALINNPKLLILDEPTNGLDPIGIKELRDILKKLSHEENVAVLISSHQLAEMNLICDKVCIINKGKILDVRDLTENSKIRYEFVVNDIKKTSLILEKNNIGYEIKLDKIIIDIESEKVKSLVEYLEKFQIKTFEVNKISESIEEIFMNEIQGE